MTDSGIPTAPATTPARREPAEGEGQAQEARQAGQEAKPLTKITAENPDGSNPQTTGTDVGVAVLPAARGKGLLAGKVIAIDPGHNPGNSRYAAEVEPPGELRRRAHEAVRHDRHRDALWLSRVRLHLGRREPGRRDPARRGREGLPDPHRDDSSLRPLHRRSRRARKRVHADAAVSIHGDGGPDSGHGFESIVPDGPIATAGLTSAMVANDLRLALSAPLGLQGQETGMVYCTYLGTDGIYRSNYYGGIDLSKVPKTLIETGNMRNDADAALMESAAWRAKAAAGIALGITTFVRGS